jgi:Leucine-rich repeat (LRR) protein
VVEIEINQGKGWEGAELSFLSKFPHLLAFEVFDFRLKSVEPIHSLHNLRRLGVSTYCRTEIRFSEFQDLVSCSLEWRPKAKSLFDCQTLQHLFLNRYNGKDVDAFATLNNLESLAILNAPVQNLHGLRGLGKLRSLRLGGLRRLSSLAGIEELANLEELEIHTCRQISAIDEIGYLSRLRRLELNNDGEIESLKPLGKLSRLQSVGFYESTNIIDGDLSPLMCQPELARISFRNRRHYNLRREDFGKAYFGGDLWQKMIN